MHSGYTFKENIFSKTFSEMKRICYRNDVDIDVTHCAAWQKLLLHCTNYSYYEKKEVQIRIAGNIFPVICCVYAILKRPPCKLRNGIFWPNEACFVYAILEQPPYKLRN